LGLLDLEGGLDGDGVELAYYRGHSRGRDHLLGRIVDPQVLCGCLIVGYLLDADGDVHSFASPGE
jgi:hypothetical protein